MIGTMFRNLRCSAIDVFRWPIIAAVVLTAGLGSYVLSAQAASAGLSAPPRWVDPTRSDRVAFSVDSSDVFTLTVLHTNDTWGYLDPCG
jgi:hypothetical protein